jgi:anti-anti-sigma regulatory factor
MPQSAASRDDRHTAAAFLTRHHQVFPIEFDGDVLIITPQGDIREFYYQDIHLESNQIVRLLQAHRFTNVVVDFQKVGVVGSIVLDSVATFCRNARGGATLCQAGPELMSILETMNFPSIWPYFPSRAEAVRAVASRDDAPVAASQPQ